MCLSEIWLITSPSWIQPSCQTLVEGGSDSVLGWLPMPESCTKAPWAGGILAKRREKTSLQWRWRAERGQPHCVIRDLCLAGLFLLPTAKTELNGSLLSPQVDSETQKGSQNKIQRQSWKRSELDLYLRQKSCILPGTVQLWFQRAAMVKSLEL